ncbi:MAG TPA: helicase-related protein, partial [Thermotogota bacterium]|nr:helicase-related protein [Thermotogota bacterium]
MEKRMEFLKQKCMESLEQGKEIVVLRGAGDLSPGSLFAEGEMEKCGFGAEWMSRNSWVDRLLDPREQVAASLELLTWFSQQEKVVMSALLYALLKHFAPRFLDPGKPGVLIEAGGGDLAEFGAQRSQNLVENFPELFEKRGKMWGFDPSIFEGLQVIPLVPDVEVKEILDLRSLRRELRNQAVWDFKVPSARKSLLQKQGITFRAEFSPGDTWILVGFDPTDRAAQEELNRFVLDSCGSPGECKVLRFSGFVPRGDLEVPALRGKLFQDFGFESFRRFEAISHSGQTYHVGQEELIQYLLEQSSEKKPRDLFFVSGTGSGKSLIFQFAAKYLFDVEKKRTIVVTPIKALMADQVRNIPFPGAAFLNGDQSFEQREEVLQKVREEDIFLLYLSPEMLLSTKMENILDPETLGLLVVDEVHVVSSWGRTFRVDYGYLGDEIARIRKGFSFPVLSTTATAIWGGPFDTVGETCELLHLQDPWIVYGDFQRDIDFQVERVSFEGNSKAKTTKEAWKRDLTVDEIGKLVDSKKKAIVYAPYVSDIQQLLAQATSFERLAKSISSFTGPTNAEERKRAYEDFSSGKKNVMLATKAFGLGIDIPDVDVVYHHRVPVLLEDYLQEIGRAGRDGRRGVARTHFLPADLSYSFKLSKMAIPSQWKLHHVFQHMQALLREQGTDFALSLEDIAPILRTMANEQGEKLWSKARVAIYLIQKDLESRFGKAVLSFRGETYQYLFFTASDEDGARLMEKFPGEILVHRQSTSRKSARGSGEIRTMGKIYKIDISRFWEHQGKKWSLKQLVWHFFNKPGEVFEEKIFPRTRVHLERLENPDRLFSVFQDFLHLVKELAGKTVHGVSEEAFREKMASMLKEHPLLSGIPNAREKMYSLLRHHLTHPSSMARDSFFHSQGEMSHAKISGDKKALLRVKRWENLCEDFLPAGSWEDTESFFDPGSDFFRKELRPVLETIGLLGLVRVSFAGGESTVFQLQCRNKTLFYRQSHSYHNQLVTSLNKSLEEKRRISEFFYGQQMSSEERWSFLKQYFL